VLRVVLELPFEVEAPFRPEVGRVLEFRLCILGGGFGW